MTTPAQQAPGSRPLVYVAGPLFTPAERRYLEDLATLIESAGLLTFLPHRDGGLAPADRRETNAVYEADIRGLEGCAVVVAVLNGTDVDSGTAFEIGYAVARGVPVLGLYEDIRVSGPHDFNVMIANGCRIFGDQDELIGVLKALGNRQ
jgi:nucleoside 2-deoxyribosyltransferase